MIKFWKKLSISHKLFICTAALFSAVLLVIFAGQLIFYEKYYYFLLESRLERSLSEFAENKKDLKTNDEIHKKISQLSSDNDAFIFVLGKYGNILHMSSYEMHISNSEKNYTVSLDNAIQDKTFFELELKEESEIKITYSREEHTPSNRNVIIPMKIEYNGKTWVYKKGLPPHGEKKIKTDTITGTIKSLNLPSDVDSKISIQRNEAFEAIMSIRGNDNYIPENGEYITHHYSSEENGSKYFIFSFKPKEIDEYILAVKPLHSVYEALYVLKDIVVFWCIAIIIIALIVSILFSRLVTRPIIRITEVTKKIKQLDFSERCRTTSLDEVGILAENINDMSQQLNNTINELVKANEQLKLDIEHERIIEKQRKEFIAVISHELKTPLGIIRAYSEGLIDGVSQQEKYLNVIINETQKMDALILDMLEDSKLELGKQSVDKKNSDLSNFISNIVKKFKEPCNAKNIILTENISSKPFMRTFDKDLLERVISNFILNAIRYSENKEIIITFNNGVFSVENEGEHIAEDELGKIWDKFYCIGNSTSHFTGGTGLGLSIAKNILNLHNAAFGVKNTEKGVMFWFRLPDE